MICQLCKQERTLRDSHIIPKFVFKWLKESGTGFLRNASSFNQRIQDGIKDKMLCDDCEERFSDAEAYFAKNIFYPIVNANESSFEYSEKLFYFIISLAWRLSHLYLKSPTDRLIHKKLLQSEEEWRNFLLHKTPINKFNQIHLLTGVNIIDAELPKGFLLYIARAVDADVPSNDLDCFLYIKLPRLIFIIPLFGLGEAEFISTRISQVADVYHCNKAQIASSLIIRYLLDRVNTRNELRRNITLFQKEKMRITSTNSWEQIKKKDLGIILEYQNRLYPDNN